MRLNTRYWPTLLRCWKQHGQGLTEKRIRHRLEQKGVAGSVDVLVDLYSWRNGTQPQYRDLSESSFEMFRTSFFPKENRYFIDLQRAIVDFQAIEEVAEVRSHLKEAVARYFPIFWDGNTNWFAVDLQPARQNRIVSLDWTFPVRELWSSFEEFLDDAVSAHEENISLWHLRKRRQMQFENVSTKLNNVVSAAPTRTQPKQ